MTQCHHIGSTPPHTGNRLDSHQCQRGTGYQNHHGHGAHPAHHSNQPPLAQTVLSAWRCPTPVSATARFVGVIHVNALATSTSLAWSSHKTASDAVVRSLASLVTSFSCTTSSWVLPSTMSQQPRVWVHLGVSLEVSNARFCNSTLRWRYTCERLATSTSLAWSSHKTASDAAVRSLASLVTSFSCTTSSWVLPSTMSQQPRVWVHLGA